MLTSTLKTLAPGKATMIYSSGQTLPRLSLRQLIPDTTDYRLKLTLYFSLPIPSQPEYIRKALLAGKHVLSEKPIAENTKDAIELLKWYNSEIKPKKVTWSVAENFRYLNSFDYAAEQIPKMGRILGFRVKMQTLVEGGKYFGRCLLPRLLLPITYKCYRDRMA
jgi:hypothetical protein